MFNKIAGTALFGLFAGTAVFCLMALSFAPDNAKATLCKVFAASSGLLYAIKNELD
jgi:hypothetical protein